MPSNKVSLPVIKRLPKYYRHVLDMRKNGVVTVSSNELATMLGTTASQVRQDFNSFGGFGQQGVGYNVESLCQELEKLLFSGRNLGTILIGTGRLGRAVGQYLAREAKGLELLAVFDKSADQIGSELAGLTVQDVSTLQDFCRQNAPQLAVLCVQEESAEALAGQLVELGIRGFWNFSHYDMSGIPAEVVVENVHLGDSLMSLGYQARNL